MHAKKLNLELVVGLSLIGLIVFMALLSFFYTPYDPNAMEITAKLQAPSLTHLLGTDQFGRDVLSRIMAGSRLVLVIGLCTVTLALVLGGLLGILAGYFGGWVDRFIMKFIEVKMAFPGTLLALMLISLWGSNVVMIILALSLMNVPRFTRVVRSGYLQYRSTTFVEAGVAIGLPNWRIMFVHILPNLSSNIYITAALSFASAILSEAGLSYLGLGLQPPLASWGKMLGEAQPYMLQAPYLAIIPGVMITLAVLGFNLLADGLRKIY
ncbi:MAG: ABC transporter permease [Niameybacter sp.]|uniref:ABC transporter permease n=1 Tax=Niameybacter sp. TaxID=2033640 RepID=UPI002FC86614